MRTVFFGRPFFVITFRGMLRLVRYSVVRKYLLALVVVLISHTASAEGYTKLGNAYLAYGMFVCLVLASIVLFVVIGVRFFVKKKPLIGLTILSFFVIFLTATLNAVAGDGLSYKIYAFSVIASVVAIIAVIFNHSIKENGGEDDS